MAALDGMLTGSKLALALGFGGITAVCGAAYAFSAKAVVRDDESMAAWAYHCFTHDMDHRPVLQASVDNAPSTPKISAKEMIAALEGIAKQISSENVCLAEIAFKFICQPFETTACNQGRTQL